MSNSEHLSHDNQNIEDEHFAEVFAQAFINTGTEPTLELCERWLRDGFVNEWELELILEAYERRIGC